MKLILHSEEIIKNAAILIAPEHYHLLTIPFL